MEKIKVNLADSVRSTASQESLMQEIYQLDFAAKDMTEYLDNHPDDLAAVASMKEISNKLHTAHSSYVQNSGPLFATDVTPQNEWIWAMQPFPWDKALG